MRIFVFALLIWASSFTFAEKSMTIFTLSTVKIVNIDVAEREGWNVKRYLIDGPLQFTKKLSAGLPNNPEEAMKIAKQRIQSMKKALGDQAVDSYRGQLNALKLGVMKVPAIVINDVDVIYGITDIWQALRIYGQSH